MNRAVEARRTPWFYVEMYPNMNQSSWERERENCAFQQLSGVSKLAAHPPSGSTSREQVLNKNNKLTHKVYTETWYIDTVQMCPYLYKKCPCKCLPATMSLLRRRSIVTWLQFCGHSWTHTQYLYVLDVPGCERISFQLSWQLKALCFATRTSLSA